ncbi:hypothetical protein SRABI04_02744 [Chryseobacterium sp. Bi04]|nr:hypothetical protein SRABI04_02744 [Chryseobacterium sp. Bi04]
MALKSAIEPDLKTAETDTPEFSNNSGLVQPM